MLTLIVIFSGILVLIAAVYYFPVPKVSFEKLYVRVPSGKRSSLNDFRLSGNLKHVPINGFDWQYLSTGAGKKSLLFLHGMGGGYDIWWQQINHFKKSHRIISVTYPPVKNLADLSAGIIAIIDREAIDNIAVIGSSLGGYLAQYLVKKYSERIERAVFANTFPPNQVLANKTTTLRRILPWLPEWLIMRNFRRTSLKAIYPASGYSELVLAYMKEQSYGMMSRDQFLARFFCVLDSFDPPAMDKLNVPALIIESDNDPLIDKHLRDLLKSTYPSVPVVTQHEQGHFPYLNAPQEYNRTLERFLQVRSELLHPKLP
jgi:pimeloyl-ACP methyl ester carboxylesterase